MRRKMTTEWREKSILEIGEEKWRQSREKNMLLKTAHVNDRASDFRNFFLTRNETNQKIDCIQNHWLGDDDVKSRCFLKYISS